jgi:hypothetical protein
MENIKLNIKEVLWAIPIIIGVICISILWMPVAIYKSYKHTEKEKKVEE